MKAIDSSGKLGSNNGVTSAGQSLLNGTSNVTQSSTVNVVTGARTNSNAATKAFVEPAKSNIVTDLLSGALSLFSGGLSGLSGGLSGGGLSGGGKGAGPFDFLKSALSFIPGGSFISKLLSK
jgi:hypothetical protein